jgi:hypothetical protein
VECEKLKPKAKKKPCSLYKTPTKEHSFSDNIEASPLH